MATRTERDWLGREKLSARMTGVSPDQVTSAVEAARASWDAGRRTHVYIASAPARLEDGGLTEALDGILELGWILHSSSLGMSTVGPNSQQAMFVFARP
jgi:hypothetical protein